MTKLYIFRHPHTVTAIKQPFKALLMKLENAHVAWWHLITLRNYCLNQLAICREPGKQRPPKVPDHGTSY